VRRVGQITAGQILVPRIGFLVLTGRCNTNLSSSAMSVKLYFARALDGALVDVTQLERGLACDCRCLHCDDPLMAKQGPEMAWHFAHATPMADRSCAESALHQAAKALLSDIGALTLPALSTTLSAQDALDREHGVEASLPAAPFAFDRVELEHSIEAICEVPRQGPGVPARASGPCGHPQVADEQGADSDRFG
jgi:hypothetical protein